MVMTENVSAPPAALPTIAPNETLPIDPPLGDLPADTVKDLVGVFKLFADETRLRILFLLAQAKECNVRTLCDLLGQSQPAVSHHLALMRAAGLLALRRDGKHNFYSLTPSRFREVFELLFSMAPDKAGSVEIDGCVLSLRSAK